jgi:hypothetical protein
LSIHNYGRNTLTGVTVRIQDVKKDEPFDIDKALTANFLGPRIEIGTLSAKETRPIAVALPPPLPEKDGTHAYQLEISAQNGVVGENIIFRKSKDVAQAWGFRIIAYRKVPLPNGALMSKPLVDWETRDGQVR